MQVVFFVCGGVFKIDRKRQTLKRSETEGFFLSSSYWWLKQVESMYYVKEEGKADWP